MMRCARAISARTTGWSIGSSRLPRHDAPGDERLDAVAHQQVVFEADEEARLARIALPSGAAAQLEVHAAALVAVRADHVEAAERRDPVVFRLVLAAQPDVGAAAGHVRGDRDRAERAGAGDDARFHRVVLRVQHLAGDAGVAKPRREPLGLLDGQRADQHRPSGRVRAPDLFDDRALLGLAMREDDVRLIDADHRPVRRDDDHVEAVELSAAPRAAVCAVPVMPHRRG